MTEDRARPAGTTLVVFYDGECPFCSNFVRLMALRRNVGSVDLVDARSNDPRLDDLWRQGLDLNEGMAATYGERLYYGSDALALISTLSMANGPFGRSLARLLSSPDRARWLYPAMKAGRAVTLKLLGRDALQPATD